MGTSTGGTKRAVRIRCDDRTPYASTCSNAKAKVQKSHHQLEAADHIALLAEVEYAELSLVEVSKVAPLPR